MVQIAWRTGTWQGIGAAVKLLGEQIRDGFRMIARYL
jgi:hypothetical protein